MAATAEFPSRGHRLIFDGIERREIEPSDPDTKLKSWYQPKFEIVSDEITADVEKSLTRVASAAFRREVTSDDIKVYAELFRQELAGGASG